MFRFAIIIFLLFCTPILAEDKPKKPKNIQKLVVSPKERITNRIIFIYDYSGSMMGDKLNQALTAFVSIAKQPIDQMEIGLIAFATNAKRWPGVPEPKAPKPVPINWAAMPSQKAILSAIKWLNQRTTLGGATEFFSALDLLSAEKRDKISVVIISDGFFTDNLPDSFLSKKNEKEIDRKMRYINYRISRLQLARQKLGLKKIIISCFGVGNLGKSSDGYKSLKCLAEITGGAFVNLILDK